MDKPEDEITGDDIKFIMETLMQAAPEQLATFKDIFPPDDEEGPRLVDELVEAARQKYN